MATVAVGVAGGLIAGALAAVAVAFAVARMLDRPQPGSLAWEGVE